MSFSLLIIFNSGTAAVIPGFETSKRLSEKEMLSLLKNPYLVARGKMLCELVKCDKCYPVMVGNGVLEFKE